MAIVAPPEPPGSQNVLTDALQFLANRSNAASGGALRAAGASEQLAYTSPHRTYTIGLGDLAQGRFLTAALPGEWRSLIVASTLPPDRDDPMSSWPGQVLFERQWAVTLATLPIAIELRVARGDSGFEFNILVEFSGMAASELIPITASRTSVLNLPVLGELRLEVGEWDAQQGRLEFDLRVVLAARFTSEVVVATEHLDLPSSAGETAGSGPPRSAQEFLRRLQAVSYPRAPTVSADSALLPTDDGGGEAPENVRAIAEASLAADAGGVLTFAGLRVGPTPGATAAGLLELERQPKVRAGRYELRYLQIPPLTFYAIWLHGTDDDIVYPIAPSPSAFSPTEAQAPGDIQGPLQRSADAVLRQQAAQRGPSAG